MTEVDAAAKLEAFLGSVNGEDEASWGMQPWELLALLEEAQELLTEVSSDTCPYS
jgi:hypothetical protein